MNWTESLDIEGDKYWYSEQDKYYETYNKPTEMDNYFTKDYFNNIIVPLFKTRIMQIIDLRKSGWDISSKMISELASQALELAFKDSKLIVETPKLDKDPDMLLGYDKKPWEIKCTSTDGWRGGEYSKRPGYYILLTYNIIGDNINIFAARLSMTEEDWITSKPKDESKEQKYYATTFGKKELLKYINENKAEILCGDIYNPKYRDGNTNYSQIKIAKI